MRGRWGRSQGWENGGRWTVFAGTAGTLILRNDKDEPTAAIGYVAYTLRNAAAGESARRPLTFAYNGGPGSSAVWLHMGALGPRRIVTTHPRPPPPAPHPVVDHAPNIPGKQDPGLVR